MKAEEHVSKRKVTVAEFLGLKARRFRIPERLRVIIELVVLVYRKEHGVFVDASEFIPYEHTWANDR